MYKGELYYVSIIGIPLVYLQR